MGVVSNKINIMEIMKAGGGGDPTIPGRVSALETETAGLIEANAKIMTSVSDCVEAIQHVQTSVATLDLESVALAEGLQRVMTSVSSGRVPMQTGNDIRFGVDGNGDYGYYKAGADTVTPFLTGGGGFEYTEYTSSTASSATGISLREFEITGKKPQLFVLWAINTEETTDGVPHGVFGWGHWDGANNRYVLDQWRAYSYSSSKAKYSSNTSGYITITYDETTHIMKFSISNTSGMRFTSGSIYTWKLLCINDP